MEIDIDVIGKDIRNILLEVGKLLKEGYKNVDKGFSYKDKQETDYLTKYDLKANELIINFLKKKYPYISIISEESIDDLTDSEFKFIIDPIDGTRNFTRGIPQFMSGIGFAKSDEIIFCATYDSIHDKMYWAQKGKGAFCNDNKINVSRVGDILKSDVDINFPADKTLQSEFMKKFTLKSGICRNIYCSHITISYVSYGVIDAYVSKGNQLWDYCQYLLIEEAGGKVTDFKGGKFDLSKDNIVCSNGLVHGEVLLIIKEINK